MATKSTSVNLQPATIAKLDERGSRSSVINRDLDRLYTLYSRALRRIGLTIDEACLIVDVLNGTIRDTRSALMFSFGVKDAIELDGLDEKWNVDGRALIEKLSTLDEISCMAVVDAAERYWYGEKYREMDVREGVKEVFGIG
jgi:hypothetical protein